MDVPLSNFDIERALKRQKAIEEYLAMASYQKFTMVNSRLSEDSFLITW